MITSILTEEILAIDFFMCCVVLECGRSSFSTISYRVLLRDREHKENHKNTAAPIVENTLAHVLSLIHNISSSLCAVITQNADGHGSLQRPVPCSS